MGDPAARKKIFISYAHDDSKWAAQLLVKLDPLERAGLTVNWIDRRIETGADWKLAIDRALDEAQVAILLVSGHFLKSDFIVEHELPRLLQAREQGLVLILLVIDHCLFAEDPVLSKIQSFNNPAQPLIDLRTAKRDKIFHEVARKVLQQFPPGAFGGVIGPPRSPTLDYSMAAAPLLFAGAIFRMLHLGPTGRPPDNWPYDPHPPTLAPSPMRLPELWWALPIVGLLAFGLWRFIRRALAKRRALRRVLA